MGKIKKKVLAAVCITMISGGTMLYAAPGKPDIAVYLNNVLQKQAGLSVDGETYLPAQQLIGGCRRLCSGTNPPRLSVSISRMLT